MNDLKQYIALVITAVVAKISWYTFLFTLILNIVWKLVKDYWLVSWAVVIGSAIVFLISGIIVLIAYYIIVMKNR